jgi:hypothetical protein
MTLRTREIRTTADYPSSRVRILSAVTHLGTEYFFTKAVPGRLEGDRIVGPATAYGERIEIEAPFTEVKKRDDGTVYEVVDREGRTHSVQRVVSASQDKMTVVVAGRKSERVSIPLSEIRSIQARRTDPIKTLIMVPVVGFLGLIALLFGLEAVFPGSVNH